jgi:hypothetical protein
MTQLCAFCLDCSEAHDSHRVQAGGATQTATGGDCHDGDLAPPRPQGSSALSSLVRGVSPLVFSTASSHYVSSGPHLALRRIVDKGLPRHQRFSLSFRETLVTVLVRSKVTLHVLLGHSLSLHRLCVAQCAQGDLKNENPSGFVNRLCSVLPLRVYAVCHAQFCERSRASRPGRRSNSVSPRLRCPQGAGTFAGQASQKVAPSQGASAWGRLAR